MQPTIIRPQDTSDTDTIGLQLPNEAQNAQLGNLSAKGYQSFSDDKEKRTDIYGIVSILIAVILGGLLITAIIGIYIGRIGIKKADDYGYSSAFSQIGFWLNIVMLGVSIISWMMYLVLYIML